MTAKALEENGVRVLPSKTNFIFVRPEKLPAKDMFERLRQQGIYVRWFDKPRIRDYLRITIGTEKEMRTLVDAIGNIQLGV